MTLPIGACMDHEEAQEVATLRRLYSDREERHA
jgi:hypothetical protein